MNLVAFGRRFKIDGLPFAFDNPGANLGWRFVQLHLPVRVENFLHADSAMRSVRSLEAGMQTPVSDAVAIAVTRYLVQHTGNLGRQLIAFQDRKSTRLNSSHLGISYA